MIIYLIKIEQVKKELEERQFSVATRIEEIIQENHLLQMIENPTHFGLADMTSL